MKVHFIGLSCFLIENNNGFRIVVDPFNDTHEWRLGPIFPTQFSGKPFGTNLVLVSEPDSDHSYISSEWLKNAPKTRPNSNPFPNLDVKGTIIYEYNGDLNIAWHYKIDGIHVAHFADNAHLLTNSQLREIGNPEVIFISPPKVRWGNDKSLNILRRNISTLKPRIVFWSHYIPLDNQENLDSEALRNKFREYIRQNASSNRHYHGENSFIELSYILENAIRLNAEYSGIIIDGPSIEIRSKLLFQDKDKPLTILFQKMLSR